MEECGECVGLDGVEVLVVRLFNFRDELFPD